ncbi:MAG: Lrp/AsnC family transcriptional regulator [Pseudomonadota bacterium]
MLDLDDFDRRLLRAVQHDSRQTGDTLAEVVGLSPTACQRRLKRLRAVGIIEREVAIVSPKAVGRPLTLVVTLSLERERADIVDAFKRLVRETPEIMAGYYLTGESDFLMIVTARDMEDFENFSRRVFYGSPHIKGFKTMVVMDRVKASYSLPID